MDKRKISKYIEYFLTKFKVLYKQKKYTNKQTTLKYILEREPSTSDLMVIFSGMPRKGIKARYNYMRTTQNFPVNRLFILDDFGYDQRGNFYLGKNKDFSTARAVRELIGEIKQTINFSPESQITYTGSSKGGWAALFFGVEEPNATVIVGALQYRLGLYLQEDEFREKNQLRYILGDDYQSDDVAGLNELLKQQLKTNSANKNMIYLHYSINEPIYEKHINYLLDDLNKFEYPFDVEQAEYKKHAELSVYFPEYLVKTYQRLS